MTFIVGARTATTDSTGGWPWSTIEGIFTILIPQESTTTIEIGDTTTTSEFTESTIMPSISLLPHSPWWTQIDGTTQTSDSTASSSSIRSSQSTESPDATTISTSSHNDPFSSSSDSSSTWSDTSSAEWSWPTDSSSPEPEPSTSNVEWAGVIVGAVFAFMIIILILIAFVVRGRRNASSRDNQNNINIRLDNGPFDHYHGPYNRPLAETNPGCVPQGWDDIRQ